MKQVKILLTSLALLAIPYVAEADLRFPINPERPIERELPGFDDRERFCKPNRNETQLIITREHLKAISDAVKCGNLAKAQDIAISLVEFLDTQQNQTPMGICYDDRKCTSPLANNATTKDMCKASGGKSWAQSTPTPGPCELVR